MDLGIAGRTALVTAASKGLGRGTALALAGEGVKVGICARGEEALRETERAIKDQGGEVLAVVADVTDPAEPARLVDAVASRFGSLDILVPNSGGPPRGRALEVSDKQIEAAINENLLTSVRLVRESVPWMRRAGWGRICLITSISIKTPIPNLTLSSVARTGLWAWAKSAASDLFADNITLNTVCPAMHATERGVKVGGHPGKMGDPDDFGRIVTFVCSEPAGFVNGTEIVVDGGASRGLL
jgi:3-oxoacyl-[acyl-carrier protein] reductase